MDAAQPDDGVIVDVVFEDGVLYLELANLARRPALAGHVHVRAAARRRRGPGRRRSSGCSSKMEFLGPERRVRTLLDSLPGYFGRKAPARVVGDGHVQARPGDTKLRDDDGDPRSRGLPRARPTASEARPRAAARGEHERVLAGPAEQLDRRRAGRPRPARTGAPAPGAPTAFHGNVSDSMRPRSSRSPTPDGGATIGIVGRDDQVDVLHQAGDALRGRARAAARAPSASASVIFSARAHLGRDGRAVLVLVVAEQVGVDLDDLAREPGVDAVGQRQVDRRGGAGSAPPPPRTRARTSGSARSVQATPTRRSSSESARRARSPAPSPPSSARSRRRRAPSGRRCRSSAPAASSRRSAQRRTSP